MQIVLYVFAGWFGLGALATLGVLALCTRVVADDLSPNDPLLVEEPVG